MHFFSKQQPDSPESTNSPLRPDPDNAHAFPGGPSPDTHNSPTFQPLAAPDGPNSGGAGAKPDSPHATGAASSGNANPQMQPTQQKATGNPTSASEVAPPPTYPDTHPAGEKRSLDPGVGAGATAARSATDAAPAPVNGDVQRSGSMATRGAEPQSTSPPRPPSPAPARRGTIGSGASRGAGRGGDMNGSAFVAGAATSGAPDVDADVQERAATAEEGLGPKDKKQISKEEQKHGRTLSTIIKGEAATEKAALEVAMRELSEIQKLQRAAVKEEAQMHTNQARAISDAHKAEMELLAARSKQERCQTAMRAAEETLEESRRHARETTDMMRDKMEEIERLRALKQADDRERAVKVKGLSGEKTGLSRFLGN